MKKWFRKNWSFVLNAALGLVVIFTLFPEEKIAVFDTSIYTQNNLERSLEIDIEMPLDSMLKIMGTPVAKEIENGFQEFHYCRTGEAFDEIISIRTLEGKVDSMSYLVASQDDVVFYYMDKPSIAFLETMKSSDCRHNIKWRKHARSSNSLAPKLPEPP